jgi:hypothetical protein
MSGRLVDRPAIASDLAVTLARLFELKYPYTEMTQGLNLFNLPQERRRICRALDSSSGYPGFMVEQYPYKLIVFFPIKAGSLELYNLEEDPLEMNNLRGHELIKKTLLFYLTDHLKRADRFPVEMEAARLREKDIENLKSLGYIKD